MLHKLHYQLAFPCWFSTVTHHRGAVYSWYQRSRGSTKTKTIPLCIRSLPSYLKQVEVARKKLYMLNIGYLDIAYIVDGKSIRKSN